MKLREINLPIVPVTVALVITTFTFSFVKYIANTPINLSQKESTHAACNQGFYTINSPVGYSFEKSCLVNNEVMYQAEPRFTIFQPTTSLTNLTFIKTPNVEIKGSTTLRWSVNVTQPTTVYLMTRHIPAIGVPAWISTQYLRLTNDDLAHINQYLLRKNEQGLIGLYDIWKKDVTSGVVQFQNASDINNLAYSMYIVALSPIQSTSLPTASITSAPTATPIPKTGLHAFPEAEGFGANTVGGRGGRVIEVTNLNDAGPGSLREAITTSGPRTIVFKVNGTIVLKSDLELTQPFITIAGQTAPGEGVQIRDGMIKITTHDVIIRYLKIRAGDVPTESAKVPATDWERDAITVNALNNNQASNIIIDHCSLVWGPDMGSVAILENVQNITVSNSILGEGLKLSNHPEGTGAGHSYNASVFQLLGRTTWGHRITFYRNLLTTSNHRNPAITGAENMDFVDNVVYNFGEEGGHGSPRSMNFINNMYIKGPLSIAPYVWNPKPLHIPIPSNAVYETGNTVPQGMTMRGPCNGCFRTTRVEPFSINNLQSPQQAYDFIVQAVGANRQSEAGQFTQRRDSADTRIINNVINRQGEYMNGVCSHCGGNQISWPNLAIGTPAADGDHDGMPDLWEQSHGLNPGQNDASQDLNNNGYTNIEEYLNSA